MEGTVFKTKLCFRAFCLKTVVHVNIEPTNIYSQSSV